MLKCFEELELYFFHRPYKFYAFFMLQQIADSGADYENSATSAY